MVIRDHDGGAIPHQFAEGFTKFAILLEVVLHSPGNLLFGHGPKHGTAVIVFVDLVAGENQEIRIVSDDFTDRLGPRPTDVLVAGKPRDFQNRAILRLSAEDTLPL